MSTSTLAKEKIHWFKSPIEPIYTKNEKDGIGDITQRLLQECLNDFDHESRSLSNQLRVFKTLKQNNHKAYCNPLFGKRLNKENKFIFSKPITYSPSPVLVILKKNKHLFLTTGDKVSLSKVLKNSNLKGIYNKSTNFGHAVNKLISKHNDKITPLYKNDINQQSKLLVSNRNDYLISYSYIFKHKADAKHFLFLQIQEHEKKSYGLATCNNSKASAYAIKRINTCIQKPEFKTKFKDVLKNYFPKQYKQLLIN